MKLSFSLGLVQDKTLTLNKFKLNLQNKKKFIIELYYFING